MNNTYLAVLFTTLTVPACGTTGGGDNGIGTSVTTGTGNTTDSNPTDGNPTATTDGGTGGAGGGSTSSGGGGSTSSGGGGSTSSNGGGGGSSSGSTPFVTEPDGGAGTVECDVWAQDCPKGEKCMPWANDGGSSWNATKCSPVDGNPGQVGDPCMPEGGGVSGVDNCDVSSMCYYVDADTNSGICVGFCQGTETSPTCDSGFVCTIVNDGVLILCRPECDPILQDCTGTAACLPASGSDRFTCIIDASGDAGATGDPCEYINSCDPGLFCELAAGVPNCTGSTGCCTEFCDLTDPNPNAACSLSGDGAECVPWYEDGMTPPDLAHVGACVLPV